MPEIERYELSNEPVYCFEPVRRDLLKALGWGILVLAPIGGRASAQESGGSARHGGASGSVPDQLGAWIHIGTNSVITVFTGKVEVGQNSRTALTQAVAEELSTPATQITLIMGDTDLTPFDMGTFGSRTTPTMAPQLRRAAVAAREVLLDRAAEQGKVARSSLEITGGKVRNLSAGATFSFGELTKGQSLTKVIGHQSVSQPRGESFPKVNGRDMVTGAHRYTSDIARPGMVHGKVLRPSSYGATLVALDSRGIAKESDIQLVRDGDFVGLTGPDVHQLSRALGGLRAEWKTVPQPSSKELYSYLKANAEGESPHPTEGSLAEAFLQAAHQLEASYSVAYIAHAPLEPRAAVAEWADGKLTVWTGTQRPFGVRTELAGAFHIPESRVRVLVPDTGSAYGGKHTGECAVEAARLAKAAGKPVKVVWTREEEFTWAYFRPGGVMDVRSGVRADGVITAWEFHNYNSGGSGIDTPYDIAHQSVHFHETQSPLRQGSYRGLAATANHFARESHMDELACAARMNPLEFRYKNLKNARLRAVLEAAAERFRWGKDKTRDNQGFGLACGLEKGGYVASCAEVLVERSNGTVKIVRVVTAFECGAIVNPEHLKNQVEGAVMMGIGGALFEAIEFENGKILNAAFSRYRVPRFSDMPVLETVLVDRKDLDSAGAGETPIVAVAPAVGNAIYNAVGVRLRALPMSSIALANKL